MNAQSPLLLASGSPRRLRLLREWGWQVRTVPPGGERSHNLLPPEEEVMARARAKSQHADLGGDQGIVVAADTLGVADDGRILGKPEDREVAATMLQTMSGTTHRVITGVWVRSSSASWGVGGVETSLVTFRTLDEEEIRTYLDGGEWRGKAGAYAIQGEAAAFVSALSGSLENVVGLPKELTLWALERVEALWRGENC